MNNEPLRNDEITELEKLEQAATLGMWFNPQNAADRRLVEAMRNALPRLLASARREKELEKLVIDMLVAFKDEIRIWSYEERAAQLGIETGRNE